MGYTTDFSGKFNFSRTLTAEDVKTINDFSEERHGDNINVYDGFPGFWCDWVSSEDGTSLEHNGAEKSYYYVEWLQYLIVHFFSVWNVELYGSITFQGEEHDDYGTIAVERNIITLTKQ